MSLVVGWTDFHRHLPAAAGSGFGRGDTAPAWPLHSLDINTPSPAPPGPANADGVFLRPPAPSRVPTVPRPALCDPTPLPGRMGWTQRGSPPFGWTLCGVLHPLSCSFTHTHPWGAESPVGCAGQTDRCRCRGSRSAGRTRRSSRWSRPSPASTTTRSRSGRPGRCCVTPAWPSPRRRPPRTTRSPRAPGCLGGTGLVKEEPYDPQIVPKTPPGGCPQLSASPPLPMGRKVHLALGCPGHALPMPRVTPAP